MKRLMAFMPGRVGRPLASKILAEVDADVRCLGSPEVGCANGAPKIERPTSSRLAVPPLSNARANVSIKIGLESRPGCPKCASVRVWTLSRMLVAIWRPNRGWIIIVSA